MKKATLVLTAVLMLVACGGNKPSASADDGQESVNSTPVDSVEAPVPYDCTDAISMGLNGHVQHISATICSTYENNGKLEDGDVAGQYEMAFNERGQITTDEWGNEYGYDAEGKYYRGNHTYTTVKRDEQGRIVAYNDIEPKKDNESQFLQSFRYDKNGRITSIEYSGGFASTWTEKRQYKSGNIYPVKTEESVSFEDGGGREVIVTYRYTSFDEQNNWTERLRMTSTKEIDEVPVDSFIPEQPKIKEEIQVEKRDISYYE